MSQTLAVAAPPAQNTELTDLTSIVPELDHVRAATARLYAMGYPRMRIARIMLDHLHANKRLPAADRLRIARRKLGRWEKDQEFRDMIWNQTVIKTDLATSKIMAGIVKKAERGNVLAARLALEVTGRHNPKGESAPSQIAIVFSDMVRPQAVTAQVNGQAVDAEVVDQVDDDED